jgi:hypothetical protein
MIMANESNSVTEEPETFPAPPAASSPTTTNEARHEQFLEERRVHNASELEAARASATSGKGNGPSVIDQFRASHKHNIPFGAKIATTGVVADHERPFHPSPTIHEGRIQALEHYEECGEYLQTSLNFLSAARTALVAVDEAHTALLKDPSKTPEARVMILSGPANKKFEAIYTSCIKTQELIIKQIEHQESELLAPLVTGAATESHKELRQVLRSSMTKAERRSAVEKAIHQGDEAVIIAALGAHPLTTGLDPEMHQALLRMYNTKKSPQVVRRIEALKRSLEIVASVGPVLVQNFEGAMRGTFAAASKVRGLSEASEKALAKILGEAKE